ncbi:phenylalanine--tRNA ligase subunit beta, partial [Patescibacteria group bacterium]
MKYSYTLLKELSGTKLSPEKLAELLTMHSFEVEGIEKIGTGLEKVVVGKILEIKKHPNADKLQLATVTIGKEKLTVVCGAPNIQVGQKVPVALVGAKLPNGLEIKPAEIRGAKSKGMLCASDELGLGKDHSGILILDKDAKVGKPFAKETWLEDAMMEIKVLPDRSHDALSHLGMAREIGAVEGRKIDEARFEKLALPKGKKRNVQIAIKDLKLCQRYIGVLMDNITIQDSPLRYQLMLKKFGINAISNVVDVTNAVMLELGQ